MAEVRDELSVNTSGEMFMNESSIPTFNQLSTVKISIFSVMFVLSLVGNTLTLIRILKTKKPSPSISILLVQLCVADLMVTFFCILVDIIWTATVQWLAGEGLCKAVKFSQVFSLNIATYVVVLMSVDQCLAITRPLQRDTNKFKMKILSIVAWLLCAIASIPQAIIFRVLRGPFQEDFYQCVTDYEYANSPWEQVYLLSSTILTFLLPVVVIIVCYCNIFKSIRESKSLCVTADESASSTTCTGGKGNSEQCQDSNSSLLQQSSKTCLRTKKFSFPLRRTVDESNRSDKQLESHRTRMLRLASQKSLKLAMAIVLSFFICWTPYFVSMFGSRYFGWDTQQPQIQASIFCFGMANSFINPLIYGAFHMSKRKKKTTKPNEPKTQATTILEANGNSKNRPKN